MYSCKFSAPVSIRETVSNVQAEIAVPEFVKAVSQTVTAFWMHCWAPVAESIAAWELVWIEITVRKPRKLSQSLDWENLKFNFLNFETFKLF